MSNDVEGMSELMQKFERLDEAVQGMALANTAKAGGMVVQNAAKDNIKAQDLIKTRNLSRSVHTEISMDGPKTAIADVGTNLEYAAIHEFGGVIVPKTRKYLAIPVGSATGSPVGKDLKVRVTNRGNLVLVSPSGQVQYVLKQSVTIPAQPYMRPAYDEHKQEVIDTMQQAYVQLIKKAVS